jgi:hypothetical protein
MKADNGKFYQIKLTLIALLKMKRNSSQSFILLEAVALPRLYVQLTILTMKGAMFSDSAWNWKLKSSIHNPIQQVGLQKVSQNALFKGYISFRYN